jgi:hypothetical protein
MFIAKFMHIFVVFEYSKKMPLITFIFMLHINADFRIMNKYGAVEYGIRASTIRRNLLVECSSTLKIEAADSSETLVSIHQNARHHIPDDSNLYSSP